MVRCTLDCAYMHTANLYEEIIKTAFTSQVYLSMVCLHCNLSLSRAEVGIIGEPPVRIRDRVWTA